MPAVAEDTLSYCTKCKMDLMHVVCAMKGDQVQKVKCHTCGTTHQFRAPKGVTEPPKKKTSKKAAAEAATATSIAEEWKKSLALNSGTPQKKYAPKNPFLLGDRIQHSSFGEGIVQRLIYPNKIEVLFETDVKILIHAGASA